MACAQSARKAAPSSAIAASASASSPASTGKSWQLFARRAEAQQQRHREATACGITNDRAALCLTSRVAGGVRLRLLIATAVQEQHAVFAAIARRRHGGGHAAEQFTGPPCAGAAGSRHR